MRSTGLLGCSTTGSDGLVSPSLASPAHFTSRNRPALLRTGLSVPVNWTQTTPDRTMTTNNATLASIGATLTLSLWAGWMLASETRDLMTRCKLGPEPAACELRLLGR